MDVLIGLAGRARSGKDTAADYLGYRYCLARFAIADPMRAGIEAMFGLSPAELEGAGKDSIIDWLGVKPRHLLQTLGSEWGRRHVAQDVWLRLLERRIDRYRSLVNRTWGADSWHGVVISDIRLDFEAQWVRERGGTVIHIERPGLEREDGHETEAGILSAPGDYTVRNDGTVYELQARLDGVMASILGPAAA